MKFPRQHYLRFACLIVALGTLAGQLAAQDGTESTEPVETKTAAQKAYEAKLAIGKPPTPAQLKAEAERKRVLKSDQETRARLKDTIWNDLDIPGGQSGQVWMLRPLVKRGTKEVGEWILNDEQGLKSVGTWEVAQEEVLLRAKNGTLIGRGKYAEDEIVGNFIDADRHRDFGKFRLREETKRNYRVLPLKVITRTLGK